MMPLSVATLLVVVLVCLATLASAVPPPDSTAWTNVKLHKQIDLTGSTSHSLTTLEIKPSKLDTTQQTVSYYFLLDNDEAHSVSWSKLNVKPALDSTYVAADSAKSGGFRPTIAITPLGLLDGTKHTVVFETKIPTEFFGKHGVTLFLETALNHITEPLPKTVKQTHPQSYLWTGDVTPRSPYKSTSAFVKVKVGAPKIVDYSPSSATKSGSTVTFGPYDNLAPFTAAAGLAREKGSVHYQSETPRATIVSLDRTAEISHWGDALSISDRILLRNSGPQLKGHFSRIDHQINTFQKRFPGSSLNSLSVLLPAGAHDPWFIDQIGNVTTSHFRASAPNPALLTALSNPRPTSEVVNKLSLLELQPRYPLLGGWNYTFSIGYTLPLSAGGFTKRIRSSYDYVTAVPLLTPVQNVAIDQLRTTIVLPEGAVNVQVELPYKFDRVSQNVTKTYLDTLGRQTIVLERKACAAEHASLVYVKYTLTGRAHLIKVASVAAVMGLLIIATAMMQRVETKIR